MIEKYRRYPKVGDIFFIDENGNKRFVSGADVTSEEAESLQAVGVVYDVYGKLYDVVAGVNNKAFQWSVACDFEIETIPGDSMVCEVKLHNKVVGSFNYTKTNGAKSEFVAQLNAWLAANAPKWEAYLENDNVAILQLSDYDIYEDVCSIAGCKLRKRVGEELADSTTTITRNQVFQRTIYNGICRARLKEFAENNKSANNNPTMRMDGETRLFVTFPCSRAYYEGELGDGLRSHFATYDDYLDACMVRTMETDRGVGIMRYRYGKDIADKLLEKKLLVRGVENDAYSSAVWANAYDSGVEGYGPGTFHLPCLSELARLMRDITSNTKLPLDPINVALVKRTGWTSISSTSNRWSCGLANLMFFNTKNFTGVRIGSGNGIMGYSGSETTQGNLYINYVSGNVNIRFGQAGEIECNKLTQRSDIRLKNKTQSLSGVLSEIQKIDAFYYTWKSDTASKRQIGISAQDVQSVYPELVSSSDCSDVDPSAESYLTVDYSTLSVVAIQAIKELNAKVEQLMGEIKQLKGGTNGTTN